MPKQYRLKALDHFTCIGSDCPDSCCKRQWDIDVDKETYKKWQSLAGSNVSKETLMQSVILPQNNDKAIHLRKIEGSNSCLHLDQAGLCSIQRELGAEMIPSTCRVYPRVHNKLKDREIHSATLSCPEIVRLVLFSDNEPVYAIKGDAPCPSGTRITAEKLYWYLEKIVNNTLVAKGVTLNIKLTYLARALAEITLLGEKGTLDDKTFKTFAYEHELHMGGLATAVSGGEFATSPANARYMWHVIVNELAKRPDLNEQLGLSKPIDELLELYKTSDGTTGDIDPFVKRIQACRQETQPVLKHYEEAFNRYLQAVFVLKNFPWKRGGHGYHDAFLLAVIPFATIQLLCWLHIEKCQKLSEEELIAIINRIEGRFGHSSEIMKYVEKNKSFYQLERYFDWFLDVA